MHILGCGFRDVPAFPFCECMRKLNLETQATNGVEDGGKSSCPSVKRAVPLCGLAIAHIETLVKP